MVKNIIIFILLVIVILQGTRLLRLRKKIPVFNQVSPTIQPMISPKPQFLTKGMKLANSPLSEYAYKIYPGSLSMAAKNATANFIVVTEKVGTASARVTFIPKKSQDMGQVFLLRPGNSLYFIVRSETDIHANYGVIVDKNGVVQ